VVKKATVRRWAPSRETVEAMANALCTHWMTAAHSPVPQTPFWPSSANWLSRQAYHFTSGGRLIR
jgi:hypothetical protein